VEPLPLQVFPRDDNGYENNNNNNFLRDEERMVGSEVRGLQIMMGQQGLLEDLAQGDLFI
jgi:hypothetical protein